MTRLLFCFFLILGEKSVAQHCAFDGAHLLVVRVSDKNGKPIQAATTPIVLQEVDNSNPTLCNIADQLISKPFLPLTDVLKAHSRISYEQWIQKEYQNWGLLQTGYFAVLLNQSEFACMTKNAANDYDIMPRQFTIVYKQRKKVKNITAPANSLYTLCTATGDWTRIEPIHIKNFIP
jgi:hypothetical protein